MVVMRTLQKDLDGRYQSLEDVRFDLEPIRRDLGFQHARDLIQISRSFLKASQAEPALNAVNAALELDPSRGDARLLRGSIRALMAAQRQRAKAPGEPSG